ncbi:uncharacterized protein [Musca autumnalis]|uniref:uncharacterized protein n=1 Tax=Musca autumnalis TaxID=221902 RepID=UPI003CEDFBC9
MSDDNPTNIAQKIEEGDYTLVDQPKGKSIIWRILSRILKPDGTTVEGYVWCKKCNKILRLDRNQTSNLIRHKCCHRLRLSLNSNKSKSNRNEKFETDNEEDEVEFRESRRSSSLRESKMCHKRKQSKHTFLLKSPSRSENSEPIAIYAKEPIKSEKIPEDSPTKELMNSEKMSEDSPTNELKESEKMSEDSPAFIAEKIEKGDYILTSRPGKSIIWRILLKILKADGTAVEGYVCCKKCKKILRHARKQTSNLVRHTCCQRLRLSLNSNESNRNEKFETDNEEDVEEIADTRRSNSLLETKNNPKRNQSQPSSVLKSPSSSEDSEPIVTNTKELKKSEKISEDCPTKELKQSEKMSEDTPTIIAQKIEEGDYVLAKRSNGRSIIWRVLSRILKADGTVVERYVCCTKCNKILRLDRNQTSNLYRHTCCQRFRFSLNSNESYTNRNERFETANDEDEEDISDSRRLSSIREINANNKRNQSKHSSYLQSQSSSEDSEPIVINAAKKPRYRTPSVSDTELQSGPETHSRRLYVPNRREETYVRSEPLTSSRQDPLQHVEKAVVNNYGHRDDSDVFSEGWGIMYRRLTLEQQIYAKRIIDDTLMHAQLGQLSISSNLNLNTIPISSSSYCCRCQQEVKVQPYNNDEDNFSDT